jgi:hypothetical protein
MTRRIRAEGAIAAAANAEGLVIPRDSRGGRFGRIWHKV